MKRKIKEIKPDVILKNYWNNNEQFADLFNAVLFEGKQIIKPEELEGVDSEASTVLEHREHAESIKANRDNIKIQKKLSASGVQFVLLGVESQELIHYAMPMRVMGYDYASYKKQYDSNAKKYKNEEGLSEDEYLSKMKKTDKFIPVITVVIYYGEKPWDGAKTLHEMLNIPKEMTKYVNDYKMLLVEARKNDLKLHNINNQDLFRLLQIILDRTISKKEAKENVIQYSKAHKTDKSVIMTVAGATNTRINYNILEGDGNMCTLFEEIAAEGKAEGIMEIAYELGLSDDDIIEKLQNKLNISLDKAQEYLEKFHNRTL